MLASLERDVFSAIGALSLDQVDRPTVLALIERIEAPRAIATARRVRQRIEKAFAFVFAAEVRVTRPPERVSYPF